MRSRVRGVLLDVDGTLVDSNDAHARAWHEALQACGYAVDVTAVRALVGMGGDQIIPRLTGMTADSPGGKALSELRARAFRERHLAGIRAFPCARALVQALRDRGLALMVATSAQEDDSALVIARAGLGDVLTARTSAADASSSKPAPDIVRAALAKLGMAAAETIMIGDTPYDGTAAARAGCGFVAFRCGGWRDEDFPDAMAVYDGPADLLAKLARSPFAPAT